MPPLSGEQILSPALHTGGAQSPVGSQTSPVVHFNTPLHCTQMPEVVLQSMPDEVQALSELQPIRQVCDTHFCPVAQSPSTVHATHRPLAVSQALPLGQSAEVVQGS